MGAGRSHDPPVSIEKIVLAARETAEAGAGEALGAPGAVGVDGLAHLQEELAYRGWHTRVFARFLEAAGGPVEAAGSLPPDMPAPLPAAAARELDRLLARLPEAVFRTPLNLGWLYQAWQKPKRARLQRSQGKIGGADLAPATQLFTEAYLVRFLLENTLGAWWAVRRPHSPLVRELAFLRRGVDGQPAAGGYPGWPEQAAEITVMDPCCGTGHFLSAAFHLLRRMRMEADGLGAAEAAAAVLRDNLFGLDLDPHCAQIAALVLRLEAWGTGGPIDLPPVNILPAVPAAPLPGSRLPEPAGGDWQVPLDRLRRFFFEVPEAGSLLDPARPGAGGALSEAELASLSARAGAGAGSPDGGWDLAGAAQLLARHYVLVATNVPYLARRKQSERLQAFLRRDYPAERADLATAFLRRSLQFLQPGGTAALVTPQNWLFLGAYQALRRAVLADTRLVFLVKIGEWGFHSAQAAGAFTALAGLTRAAPEAGATFFGLDAAGGRTPAEKSRLLQSGPLKLLRQAEQASHPEARLLLEADPPGRRLGDYARSLVGLQTGDHPYYLLRFWEVPQVREPWALCLTPAVQGDPFGGRESVLRWESGQGRLRADPGARIQGLEAVGREGVAVLRVRAIRAFYYHGELYDQNVAVILPHDPAHLPAVRAFCAAPEFSQAVRRIDQKLNVTNATLTKVPFELERWQRVAEAQGPPAAPEGRDPRQWLFGGDPAGANEPLQAAVARLLGYSWPGQAADHLDRWAVPDGIAPLPPMEGVPPAAERLRALLAAAYGPEWSLHRETGLLAAAGCDKGDLESWLRDRFFAGHCRLFRNRPFIWHLWDGRRDGFAALVNYHRLTAANLERLVSVYLDGWIEAQRREAAGSPAAGRLNAAARLTAALTLRARLEAIQAGEPPYDLYARWKSLAEQPLGWDPDLEDGVRVNIRPFVAAGVLRSAVHVQWKKDRGRNPDGSERLNDLHYTRAEKLAARRGSAY